MIYIGADHAGYSLKEKIKKFLEKNKYVYKDLGTYSEKPVDYPEYAFKVSREVKKNKRNKGILICGTGTGMCMAANRMRGIRAALIYDTFSAKMSRLHNNANIACLRGRIFSSEKAKKILKIWLTTKFSHRESHKKRIGKLD